MFTLLFAGAFLGLFGVGYIKVITQFPLLWTQTYGNPSFPNDPSSLGFVAGKPWWIAVGAGMGLAVGLTRLVLRLDDPIPSFLEELHSQHVEPVRAVKVVVCALLTLMGGGSMGPEAGLGAFGGTTGQFIATYVRKDPYALPLVRQKLYVVSSMAAAFSAFLPNPFTAVLLVVELGLPPDSWGLSYMHLITMLSGSAGIAFVVYYSINNYVYINPMQLAGAAQLAITYQQEYIFIGVAFGAFGSCLAIVFFLVGGVVKAVATSIKDFIEGRMGPRIRRVLIPVFGGTVQGVLMYIFPMVIGDGNLPLPTVLSNPKGVGNTVLVVSAFVKMLAYWICKEFDLVGGIFFPTLLIGSCFGGILTNLTGVNPLVAKGCSMICLPAAFCSIPVALILIVIASLETGAQATIPLFATVMTAYVCFVGLGIPQFLRDTSVP